MTVTGNVYYAYNSILDVAVLIDGTFTSFEFNTIRRFLTTFQDRFYVLPTLTRFAVVQFSQSARTTFGFTQYRSNAMLRTAFTNLQQQSTGRERNLASAITYTFNNVFNQRRADSAWVSTVTVILCGSRESWTTRNVLWSRASMCLSVRGRIPNTIARTRM